MIWWNFYTKSKLTEDEISEQIGRLYSFKHTIWIDEIIVLKENKLVDATKRKN